MSIAQTRPDAVVLAADTLVALDDRIIGKPADLSEAAQMLQPPERTNSPRLFCRCNLPAGLGKSAVFHESSRVSFRRLSDAMIQSYLAKIDTLDKAGAYAAQGSGAEIIAKIEGSFTNVVGLPMEKTVAELAAFRISPKAV